MFLPIFSQATSKRALSWLLVVMGAIGLVLVFRHQVQPTSVPPPQPNWRWPQSVAIMALDWHRSHTIFTGNAVGDIMATYVQWKVVSPPDMFAYHPKSPVKILKFNQSYQLLASGHHDGTVRIWDVKPEPVRIVKTLTTSDPNGITDLSWSPSGERLAGCTNSGQLYVWSHIGERQKLPELSAVHVTSVGFMTNDQLVIGFRDGMLYQVDLKKQGLAMVWAHPGPIANLIITAPGVIITTHPNSFMDGWVSNRSSPAWSPKQETVPTEAVASAKPNLFATDSETRTTILLWQYPNQVPWARLPIAPPHDSLTEALAWAFSEDTTMLAVATNNKELQLWLVPPH